MLFHSFWNGCSDRRTILHMHFFLLLFLTVLNSLVWVFPLTLMGLVNSIIHFEYLFVGFEVFQSKVSHDLLDRRLIIDLKLGVCLVTYLMILLNTCQKNLKVGMIVELLHDLLNFRVNRVANLVCFLNVFLWLNRRLFTRCIVLRNIKYVVILLSYCIFIIIKIFENAWPIPHLFVRKYTFPRTFKVSGCR